MECLSVQRAGILLRDPSSSTQRCDTAAGSARDPICSSVARGGNRSLRISDAFTCVCPLKDLRQDIDKAKVQERGQPGPPTGVSAARRRHGCS